MKQQITEAEDRIKTTGIVNFEQVVNRDFAVETMKEVERNITNNMNLILYNYVNERDEAVKDILSISRHSWRTTEDIQYKIRNQTTGICSPANIIGVGDAETRSFDSLMRRCEVWLEDASFELTDQIIAIIDLTKKLASGRIGNFDVLEKMNGAEDYADSLYEAFNNFDNSTQKILAKFLNENNYTSAISEMNNLSINLIHEINLIMNGRFPTEKYNLKRPIKPARELLNLFESHFKDNTVYSKILDVVYGEKLDSSIRRHKTHNPEKQKIIFIAQRNFEYLKENDKKIKELT
jgi:hypothetical protein